MHVVVIGFGNAGGLTSIELARQGHSVTLLEKMSMPGGISITAAGGVRCSNNADATFQYLQSTNAGTTDDAILKRFADAMTRIPERVQQLAVINGSEVFVQHNDYNGMPQHHCGYPGWQSLSMVRVTSGPEEEYATKFPNVVAGAGDGPFTNAGGLNGIHLFNVIYDNVIANDNIDVRYNTPVHRLIKEQDAVVGVKTNKEEIRCDAVVIASGGFENSDAMKIQYWQGKPVLPNTFLGNTGDGIRMAQSVGADLWHMWHYHGTYGFAHPAGFGVRIKGANVWSPTVAEGTSSRPLIHIVVDQNGRRFMNEYPPYISDTAHRPMEWFSPEEMRYPRIPAYFISDERGRTAGPWGSIRANLEQPEHYYWSEDNSQEIEQGIFRQCETLAEVAEFIGCNPSTLNQTLAEWNSLETDDVYHRPASSLEAIDNPPYYVAEVWPVACNTQGGPRKNENFQVLDPYGDVIPGLYVNGECGSIWGHMYMSAGNFAECFVGSELIAQHLSR